MQDASAPNAPMDPVAAFEVYHDRIYGYALRLVRDPAEADDLVQDTFMRAHSRLASLRDPGPGCNSPPEVPPLGRFSGAVARLTVSQPEPNPAYRLHFEHAL